MFEHHAPDAAPLAHPFDALTPDLVQDALASLDLWGDGRLSALSSYENRVYLAHLERPEQGHDAVVLKFYRPERWSEAQILEEHAFAHELAEADVPMVAPLRLRGATLHHHAGFAFSVSPRRGGRMPELDDFEVLEWTGRLLARLHSVGARQAFASRPVLNAHTFGEQPMQWLLENDFVTPGERREWETECRRMLAMVAQHPALLPAQVASSGIRQLRLHGDCHPGNILWTPGEGPDAGPHFVDLDDARTGPAVQDLWMLAQGDDRAQRSMQLSTLIEGYEQVRDFDRRELALVEPLRSLRLLHYSCWLAQRQRDPAFERAFAYFGSPDYWREQIVTLREQCEAMAEPPLMV